MFSFLRKKFPILSTQNQVIKNLGMYFFAVGLNRGMSFLLIPVLTNVLNTEEYGIISIAAIIIGLLKNIIGLNPSLFIIANFFKTKKEELTEYISNFFLIIFVSSFILFGVFYLVGSKINFFPSQSTFYLFLIFITAILIVIETLILTVIQMEKKGGLFFSFSLISALLQLLFVFTFVVFFRGNWRGKLFADFLAEMVICIILLIYLRKEYPTNFSISKSKIQELLAFSLPFLPHGISIWVMNFVDRFFLERIVGIQSVGLYSAAYNLGLGLMLIYDALQRTWQPYFFELLAKNDVNEKRRIVKFTWFYYLCAITLFFISTYFAYLFTPILFGKEFESAFEFVPLIFLGYTFQGMYRVVAGYLYHLKKNGLLALITISSAILNICLNYFLISNNGAIGAAQSTAITFFYTFLMVKFVVIKADIMPWFYFLKPENHNKENQGK